MTKSKLTRTIEVVRSDIKNRSTVEHLINLFKATLSVVPIGGAFASLIDDYIPTRKTQRIECFLEEVAAKLVELQEEIEEQRIVGDHFAFVFEQCVRGVSFCPQKEKIECYKAILINAAMPSEDTDEQQEYFLNLVNTLSPIHIRLLGALHAAMKVPQNGPECGQTIRTMLGEVDGDIIMSAAAELYQLQFTNTQPTSMPFTADLSRVGGRLRPIARKFIEFCTLKD
ncbi:hypothetical protein A3C37_04175 [Candidatus Peribacteria bacterium RIFCSPHIGHO2_02_FULL_53_20]|nr:MAG: hypothetical protein A3C37_04175 [Candidatus Peribacteria bacterium RIFCSPHIGHO2_02_FULL_53_20]